MPNTPAQQVQERKLSDAKSEWLQQQKLDDALQASAHRLAFADPEFMLRPQLRGVRVQLEMLKPDLEQAAQGIDHTVVVFGSARFVAPEVAQVQLQAALKSANNEAITTARRQLAQAQYYEQARQFARLVASYSQGQSNGAKLYICTGGGPGIMEAANRGAHELGEPTVGLSIALPHEQGTNPYVTPALSFQLHYFAIRKMHFMLRAKALVVFPGGFGTLDELFEVITLVQTGKSQPVPIVLFGSHYWQRLLNLEFMVEEGVISPEDARLLCHVDSPQAAWSMIKDFYAL